MLLVLGNKTDLDGILEQEIEEIQHKIRKYHKDVRGECTVAECKHLIFSKCSLLTEDNVQETLKLLAEAI